MGEQREGEFFASLFLLFVFFRLSLQRSNRTCSSFNRVVEQNRYFVAENKEVVYATPEPPKME